MDNIEKNLNGKADDGPVVVLSDDTFIEEVLGAETPVLVDFMATWCGPCKYMGPVFAGLAPEYEGKVKFAKLDVDESPGVASALQVNSIPTFMLFKQNTLVAAGRGAMQPHDLRAWIDGALDRLAAEPVSSE